MSAPSVLKKSSSLLGPIAVIAGVGFIAYAAYKALSSSSSDSSTGSFTMGGTDEAKGLYAGQDPVSPAPGPVDDHSAIINKMTELAAQVDALKASETGTGSNSESLLDPHDNPIPSAAEGPDISTQTAFPTPKESAQADFLTTHPVMGWSLVGASLIPSYFSRAGTKVGVKFAETIAPDMAAKRGITSATDAAVGTKSLDKRAVSFLDRQVLKSAEKNLGQEAAEAGFKVAAKKGLMTGAKIGIKSLPVVGLAAGIAIDKASGIGTAQAITRNAVGDVVGGFTGIVGALGGPVGSFGGAVGGQLGGEYATDWVFGKAGWIAKKPLTMEEKRGLAAANPTLLPSGQFGFSSSEAIMSNFFRASQATTAPASLSSIKGTPASMLAQANAYAAKNYASLPANTLSQYDQNQSAMQDIRNVYAKETARASSSGRAQVTNTSVVGTTGNIYIKVPGTQSSYKYVPGASTKTLGASAGSSSASKTATQKAKTAASISKATSGPKISAKGKYTASK